MTNGELAKELSQYPLTAIATGLLNFERFNKKLSKSDEESLATTYPTLLVTTNPLQLSEEERRKLFGERVKMIRKLRGMSANRNAATLSFLLSRQSSTFWTGTTKKMRLLLERETLRQH